MILLAILPILSLFSYGAAQGTCEGYEDHPLVLVSMDGFRYDYVKRGLSPALQALMDEGVTVPFMKASYPTVTFPNHYTIVTGLYPESHGIISNSFYDEDFGASFSVGSASSVNGRWWGGDPIWNTVQNQGKKSAAFFWPGSDANVTGMYPTYWYPYDGSVPFEDRVTQVLDWLSLPVDERPIWICTYFDEPDHTGHETGPDSNETNIAIANIDIIIKSLVDGIANLNLTDCVNLVVVADHGMAEAGLNRVIHLENYLPNIADQAYVYYGAFSRLSVWDEYKYLIPEMKANISCEQPELRQYEPFELPTRFHFSNNPARIEDIVLDLNPGYTINVNSDYYSEGKHGYDNYFKVMQPIFVAKGPDFLSGGVVAEPFQNIELYRLMCELVGVTPSPNNGTAGSLYSLLLSPPAYPVIPVPPLPSVLPFPDDTTLQDRLDDSGCSGDLSTPEAWVYSVNLTSSEISSSLSNNLPWGLQYKVDQSVDGFGADVQLLVDFDCVTAYSPSLKQALWTSFTVSQEPIVSPAPLWSSDVRVDTADSITCNEYAAVSGVTMQPMFPPIYSSDPEMRVPFMVSNAVPMTPYLIEKWSVLVQTLLPSWVASSLSPVNVVIGPVYDNIADSYADDISTLGVPPAMPSDLFLVVTRCNQTTSDLSTCPPDSLDVNSYIYPEFVEYSNCLADDSSYPREFSAKVKDVELATDLYFYPELSYKDRTRLAIRINSQIWQ